MQDTWQLIRDFRHRPFNLCRFHPALPDRELSFAVGYAFAVLAVATAFLIKDIGPSSVGPGAPFLLLALAIFLAAWAGGWGPGMLATLLAAAGVYWFFLSPDPWDSLVPITTFLLEGFIISILIEYRLQSAEKQERLEKQLREANRRITKLLETTLENVEHEHP